MPSPEEELYELKCKPDVMKYIEGLILDKKAVTSKWVSWFCSLSIKASEALLEEVAFRNGVARSDIERVYVISGVLMTGEKCVTIVLDANLEYLSEKFKDIYVKQLYSLHKKNLAKNVQQLLNSNSMEIPDDCINWPVATKCVEYLQSQEVLNSLEMNFVNFFISEKKERECAATTDKSQSNEERKRTTFEIFTRPPKIARMSSSESPRTKSPESDNAAGTSGSSRSQGGKPVDDADKASSVSSTTVSESAAAAAAVIQSNNSKEDAVQKGRKLKLTKSTKRSNSLKGTAECKSRQASKPTHKKMRRIISFSSSGSEADSFSSDEEGYLEEPPQDVRIADIAVEDAEMASKSSAPKESQEVVAKVYTKTMTSETIDAEDGFIVTKKVFSHEEVSADSKTDITPDKADTEETAKKLVDQPSSKRIKLKQSSLTDFFKK